MFENIWITVGMWVAFALGIYLGITIGKVRAYKEINAKIKADLNETSHQEDIK